MPCAWTGKALANVKNEALPSNDASLALAEVADDVVKFIWFLPQLNWMPNAAHLLHEQSFAVGAGQAGLPTELIPPNETVLPHRLRAF